MANGRYGKSRSHGVPKGASVTCFLRMAFSCILWNTGFLKCKSSFWCNYVLIWVWEFILSVEIFLNCFVNLLFWLNIFTMFVFISSIGQSCICGIIFLLHVLCYCRWQQTSIKIILMTSQMVNPTVKEVKFCYSSLQKECEYILKASKLLTFKCLLLNFHL